MNVLIFLSLVIIPLRKSSYYVQFCGANHNELDYIQNRQLITKATGQIKSATSFYYLWHILFPGPIYNSKELLKSSNCLYPATKTSKKEFVKALNTAIQNSEKREASENTTATAPLSKRDDIDFQTYHSLEKIYTYIDELPWKYPHLTSVEIIGNSSEGRPIKLVKVSVGDVGVKAALLIVGGMQANNWLTTSTVLYAIQQLIENPVNTYMLGKADWFLIPVANPDGYEYSLDINQSWIKTRSNNFYPDKCIGVNLNRNYDYRCQIERQYNYSCNNFFAGPKAFSEYESNAVKQFIMAIKVNIQLYINLDGFGQTLEFPLDSTKLFAQDSSDLKYIANQVSYAIGKYGGNKYEVKSLDSCGSEYWARRIGIKYSYKFRLPQKPALSNILSIAQEIFVALREFQRTVVAFYGVTYDLITED